MTEPTRLSPPSAPRRPHVWQRPTGDVEDPWAWMRDVDDPAFRGYLDAENLHAEAWLGVHEPLVDELFDEIRSRVQEDDAQPPVRYGDWWYVTRTAAGASYPIHHRGPTPDEATEVLVLDENAEAAGHAFFDLGAFDVSPDHRLLAWSRDVTGDEHYTLFVRDLTTSTDLTTEIQETSNEGVAWSRDGGWLFYLRADESERPCEVWRHRVGSDAAADVLVHREDDRRFHLSLGATRSLRWIVIEAASATSAEVALIPADTPLEPPRTVFRRRPDVDYHVDDWGDRVVVLTNDDAEDFRVLAAPDPWARTESWEELVTHRAGRRLTAIEPFADHLVLHEWDAAQPRLRVLARDGSEHVLDLERAPHDVELGPNPQWHSPQIRFRTNALADAPTEWEHDLYTSRRVLVRRTPTPNVDLDAYVSSREWAVSDDGTRVPVDLVRHRDTPLDGTAPVLVYGYAAYEVSVPPWFSIARLSLLDRSWIWALAHPRGGGEMGRSWYLNGKLRNKPNSFADMEACARHLVDIGYVDPRRLALRGGSAGGLLVGACTVRDPGAYAAVVAEVPFVDVVSTMSDDALPLTVIEREEWGDPREAVAAQVMESYSPYDNTRPADYPAMYVTGGLNDPRVGAHEPAKWVARLRSVNTGTRPILLRTDTSAGHGGPSGRYAAWRDEARILAFLLSTV